MWRAPPRRPGPADGDRAPSPPARRPTGGSEPGEALADHDGRPFPRRGRRRRHRRGHDRSDGDRRAGCSAPATAGEHVRARRRGHRRRPRGLPGRGPCSAPAISACWPARPERCPPAAARVGVLSTGDELVEGGGRAAAGPDPGLQPPDPARPAAPGRLRRVDLGLAADDEAVITRRSSTGSPAATPC